MEQSPKEHTTINPQQQDMLRFFKNPMPNPIILKSSDLLLRSFLKTLMTKWNGWKKKKVGQRKHMNSGEMNT